MRFIDYSRLYNEVTGEIVLLNDIPANKESHNLDNLYYLKYKPSDVDLLVKNKPYLESQNIDDHGIEGILSLNRDNYQQILK